MNASLSAKETAPSPFRAFLHLLWDHPGAFLGIGLLPRILGIICLVGEIVTGLAFLAAIVVIPFSQSRVAGGREGIRINVLGGLCDVHFGDVSNSPGGGGFGSLSVSPLFPWQGAEAKDAPAQDLSIRETAVMATIVRPADAARALEYVRWPFVLSLLCTGVTGVVILDLFRRMLGSVAAREVFTAENIRNVNRLGLLFIGSTVAKLLLTLWLVHRFVAFVALNQMHGSEALKSFVEGDGSGIGIGLMLIVLAEVFRQGLALKEESQLTI